LRQDAVRAVRVDLAMRALVRAEKIEPTVDEVDEELEKTAEAMGVDADQLRTNLRDSGRVVAFNAEVAKWSSPRAAASGPTTCTRACCGAHHLPRHADRRHGGQPGLRPDALPGVRGAPDKDIHLYINSPGGDITALFAIYDTMKYIKPDVSTFCFGQAASAAAVLLAPEPAGKRFALPHARILLHQPWGGVEGQASDIELQAKEILRMRDLLNGCWPTDTGQTQEKVAKDTDRDFIMTRRRGGAYG
jgi:hypothetical protein